MTTRMTRAMFYCNWCRNNPTTPCDAHRRGYEAMLELQQAARPLRAFDPLTYSLGIVVGCGLILALLWMFSVVGAR